MAHSLGSQVFGEKEVFLPDILSKDMLQMCSFVEIPEKLSTVQSVSLECGVLYHGDCFWLQRVDEEC